ncbi:unnamed protein product [Somion occarium]|uniref:RanBP2-type domain-containing protein n=2 Tax=Somion occarium TaxID=3059160 RepID=A0ABP1CTJ4_9APHY
MPVSTNLVSSSLAAPQGRVSSEQQNSWVDSRVKGLRRLSIPSISTADRNSSARASPMSSVGGLPYWAQLDRIDSRRSSPSTSSSSVAMENAATNFSQDPFYLTRSRVLRLSARTRLSEYTLPDVVHRIKSLQPTLWKSSSSASSDVDGVFLVFRTHEEACTAISLSSPSFPLYAALESELEHIQNLQQLLWSEVVEEMATVAPPQRMTPLIPFVSRRVHDVAQGQGNNAALPNGLTPLQIEGFNLSSNPPNPKLSFRAGDWMCSVRHCAAHNFGRNVACIRCGTPRTMNTMDGSSAATSPISPTHHVSPRFINAAHPANNGGQIPNLVLMAPQHPQVAQFSHHAHAQHVQHQQTHPALPNTPLTPISSQPPHTPHAPNTLMAPLSASGMPKSYPPIPSSSPSVSSPSKAPSPSYPLLTPSGHALSAGGRVRNISTDPLMPCIMYWPDNEPLPERGQIRPLGSAVIQYPPIINTGNKGAAEKQPGDWVCSKCNYLNWRRRKVCQTCYPYAEGNGDSISAAVQAERIALLANVLNRSTSSSASTPSLTPTTTPASSTSSFSSFAQGPTAGHTATQQVLPPVGGVERQLRSWSSSDHPQFDRELQNKFSHPIYQTSGHPSHLSHPSHPSLNGHFAQLGPSFPSESNFLPSFLQDIIHSPSLSPATSCSSGFEGPHYTYSSNTSVNASPDSSSRGSIGEGRPRGNSGHGKGSIGESRHIVQRDRSASRQRPYTSSSGSNGSDLSIWRLDGEETRHMKLGGLNGSESSSNGLDGLNEVDEVADTLADFDIAGKTPTNCAVFA